MANEFKLKNGFVIVGDGTEINAVSTDTALGGTTPSDNTISTQNAIKTYIDNRPSGGGDSMLHVEYYKDGVIGYPIVLSKFENSTYSIGFSIPTDSKTYELVGFEFNASTGQSTQATDVSVRFSEIDKNSGTAYTIGAGTTINSSTVLTVAAATAASYYINSSNSITSTSLTNGKILFVEIDVKHWTLSDVNVTAIIEIK